MPVVNLYNLEPKDFTLQSASVATEDGTVAVLNGKYGGLLVHVVGASWAGTITFKATQDGTNYVAVEGVNVNDNSKASTTTNGAPGSHNSVFRFDVTGVRKFMAPHTRVAGTVTVTATAQVLPSGSTADVQLAAGTNNIGDVDILSIAAGTNIIGKVGIDQTTPGTTNLVQVGGTLPAFAATPAVTISGSALTSNPSASQTRPNNATAYTAGDVVGEDPATNLTFTTTLAAASGFIVVGASLRIDVAAVPSGMAGFRLHLYDAAPTGIADNAAFNLPSADRGKYLGYVTLLTPVDVGDTLWAMDDGARLSGKLAAASQALYGILETLGAYTPSASTVKTVELLLAGV